MSLFHFSLPVFFSVRTLPHAIKMAMLTISMRLSMVIHNVEVNVLYDLIFAAPGTK